MKWAEDTTWNKKVAGFAWVTTNTKIKDIPQWVLAQAIARQEWFTGQITS